MLYLVVNDRLDGDLNILMLRDAVLSNLISRGPPFQSRNAQAQSQ